MWKWAFVIILLSVMALGLIQLVPYGRVSHSNPPVLAEPDWNSPVTRQLSVRACFDCHSNETAWPWYSNVAPVSWLVQKHVEEGREVLNFSEWNRTQKEASESAEKVRQGEMPPRYYVTMHRISVEDLRLLADGLGATLGQKGRDD